MQVIGRAWRHPQQQVVRVYYILARDTTDVMMAGMALRKSEMLGKFLTSESFVSQCLQPLMCL